MKSISLSALTLIISLSVSAQAGFQVSPGKIFFHANSGQPETQTVTVTNSTPNPLVLQCGFNDWKRDSLGTKIYSEPGSFPHSNGKFVKVIPETIALKAGETKSVEVTIIIPKELEDHASNSMLFLTQVNERDLAEKNKDKRAMILFKVQIGVHVYNEPPVLQTKNVEINNVDFIHLTEKVPATGSQKKDSVEVSYNELKAYIENAGQLIAEGTVRFELTHQRSLEETKLEPVTFNSLPGDKLILKSRLPQNLAKGKYAVVTIVDFGTDQPLKVAESEIELK